MSTYSEPVNALLSYGVLSPENTDPWPDHTRLGIGPEHIPDLIRMATDTSLMRDEASDEEFSAPVYAAYILGELHAQEAIEPLLSLFDVADEKDHEWLAEELPRIYGKIGPAAIPALTSYLADSSHDVYASAYASNALVEIAKAHPEERAKSIMGIRQRLERFEENDPELNGFLVADLSELKEKEALPLIEKVFAADAVDEMIINMDDVLVDLGLKEREKRPDVTLDTLLNNPALFSNEPLTSTTDSYSSKTKSYSRPTESYSSPNAAYWRIPETSGQSSKNKQKNKGKMAKASRKKNKKR